MISLTFSLLRNVNAARGARIHANTTKDWSGADWSNAMCGEAGEAANCVKKLRRLETGIPRPGASADEVDLRQDLAKELADTIIYADLLANYYGIDLEQAIVAKFNFVSQREGVPERL